MTTRRSKFERRDGRLSRREMEKAREERFVKNLTDARDALDSIIDDVTMGDTSAVGDKVNRVHRQAERMEGEGR